MSAYTNLFKVAYMDISTHNQKLLYGLYCVEVYRDISQKKSKQVTMTSFFYDYFFYL